MKREEGGLQGFWSMLGCRRSLRKNDDGADIQKPHAVQCWVERPTAHLSSKFPKQGSRAETILSRFRISSAEREREREREIDEMPHSSSHLLLITAPATGCFHEHHHLKCGAVALNWSKSYKYASTFVSAAARVGNSKSSSRCLIRCDYQLADLAPATSATYGLLLLGGGLFACKLFHFFSNFVWFLS